jgi:hypothetical protein
MGASSAKILTISCGMSRGKLEAQVLDCGCNAALLQKMILLIFCAFGEIALPCSAVIDNRYNAGNANSPRQGANGDVGAPERFTAGQAWFQGDCAFLPFRTGRPAARARLASIKRCKRRNIL